MSFSRSTFTAPSGAFESVAKRREGAPERGSLSSSARPRIYNPAVLQEFSDFYETKKVFELGSDEVVRAAKRYRKVTTEQFARYSKELEKLVNHLGSLAPHCSLAPLRGAAKPSVMAEVMSRAAIQYEFFDFRENSNKLKHPRFMRDLTEILARRDPGQEEYRINITDASRGGQGINNLVPLMAAVKDRVPTFRNQVWLLDLNLFNDQPSKAHLTRIEGVRDFETPHIHIAIHLYKVPYLIVEDFTPALTFDLEWDGQRRIFLPRDVAGQFLYEAGNQVSLIETDNSYLTFEELYSRSITKHLTGARNLRQVGVVFQEYQKK